MITLCQLTQYFDTILTMHCKPKFSHTKQFSKCMQQICEIPYNSMSILRIGLTTKILKIHFLCFKRRKIEAWCIGKLLICELQGLASLWQASVLASFSKRVARLLQVLYNYSFIINHKNVLYYWAHMSVLDLDLVFTVESMIR